MRILVIDSHKGRDGETPQNLHWKNAKIIADELKADLIWSYPSVNTDIRADYQKIVFIHASHYTYTDLEWLNRSPTAELFYVTNEYNLGEPRTLWTVAKRGRKYTVIANHPPEISKVVKKYTKDWIQCNLNSLVVKDSFGRNGFKSRRCVYFGNFRKGRIPSFKKHLRGAVVISTHISNREKFEEIGITGPFVDRLDWNRHGAGLFDSSLYLEDEITHFKYNHLANRFYEALNYDVPTIFDSECRNTIEQSGFEVPDEYILVSGSPIPNGLVVPDSWKAKAKAERSQTLSQLKEIILS